MKIVVAGGTGFIGRLVTDYFRGKGDEVVVLSRKAAVSSGHVQHVVWDGATPGPWMPALEGADVLINLAGKSVNCRYTKSNKEEILYSRLRSTNVLGQVVKNLKHPPSLWIQSSSATFYRHSETKMMDEYSGETGISFSEQVCQQWENAFNQWVLPQTRKVILRTGIVLKANDSALKQWIRLVKCGLGGTQGSGRQCVSWIHHQDFQNILCWLIKHPEIQGVINATSPQPIRNQNFMEALRHSLQVSLVIPLPTLALELGARLIGTETELILKSRKVYPQRLLDNGFVFEFPDLKIALGDLCQPENRKK